MSREAGGGRSTWAAIAWAEALTVAGLVLLLVALVRSIDWCLVGLGCDSELRGGGVEATLAALGGVALLAAPVVAAWLSGRAAPVATAALALVAFVAAVLVGGMFFVSLVENEVPALVLALGVEGSIAVRPPSRRAVIARTITVGGLVVLAAVLSAGSSDAVAAAIVLALLTLPAIGLADAVGGGPGPT